MNARSEISLEPTKIADNEARLERIQKTIDRTHEAVDRLAESAGPAVERIRASAHQATDRLGDRADQLARMPVAWAQTSRDTVRVQPLMAVGIAFAAGVALAALARR